MTTVAIPSADSAAKLRFSDFDGSNFAAELTSPDLSDSVRVDMAAVEGLNGDDVLVDLFKTMSENWRNWKGELNWGSLEGGFELSRRRIA